MRFTICFFLSMCLFMHCSLSLQLSCLNLNDCGLNLSKCLGGSVEGQIDSAFVWCRQMRFVSFEQSSRLWCCGLLLLWCLLFSVREACVYSRYCQRYWQELDWSMNVSSCGCCSVRENTDVLLPVVQYALSELEFDRNSGYTWMNQDVSLVWKEFLPHVVGSYLSCDDSQICAGVSLQRVDETEVLVGCRRRTCRHRRYDRRSCATGKVFGLVMLGLATVLWSLCAPSGTGDTNHKSLLSTVQEALLRCFSLPLPLTVEKQALALVLAVRFFGVTFGPDYSLWMFVKAMVNFTQKLLFWSCELQHCFFNVRHRPSRLHLIKDLVCRFSFGD